MPKGKFLQQEKDIVIDIFRTALERSGMSIYQVAEACNHRPTVETMQNWFYGDVLQPKRWGMSRALKVVGVETEYKWRSSLHLVVVNDVLVRRIEKEANARRAAKLLKSRKRDRRRA